MKRLVWTPRAIDDIARLTTFLRQHNVEAAKRAAGAIRSGVKTLRDNAEIGRTIEGLDPAFREWLIEFGSGSYAVRYRVNGQDVVLLTIRHGREVGH